MSYKFGDKHLKVVESVGVKWKKLGLLLQFDYDVIETIENDARSQTEECCLKLLNRWLKGEACHPVTWERLIEALRDAEHAKLASQLELIFS